MASWSTLLCQDAMSPQMEWLIFFHDFTLLMNIIITTVIMYIMLKTFMNNYINLKLENQTMEIIWTIIPIWMIITLALPSLKILYLIDEIYTPLMTMKCIGHQWFWTYEYSDFNNSPIESYMNKDINLDSFRLLDTTSNLTLPTNCQLRLLISSEDVIHSFAVPSLGLKMDAVPGRLNQMSSFIDRVGTAIGQCSEICGANHSFMPIVIDSVTMKIFTNYMNMNNF